jgi:hypothetical protein
VGGVVGRKKKGTRRTIACVDGEERRRRSSEA